MSKKPPKDPNKAAKSVIDSIISKHDKDPLAVELGRRGGLKGGKARAKALSPERRKEISKKALEARWGKSKRKSKPK